MGEHKRIGTAEAKEIVLAGIAAGKRIEPLMESVDRTAQTYKDWRNKDAEFARRCNEIREERRRRRTGDVISDEQVEVPKPGRRDIDFETFRKEYLGQKTYDHHRAWISAIERNEVPDSLPGVWVTGKPVRILINTPPFHSKSTVITVEYVVYRICLNPNIRIAIISKTQNMAKTFLYAVKQRLTDPRWAKLQAAYAPDGGFKSDEAEWSATRFYVSGISSDQKDPTCQALGIGNQIYGARLDLAILDDVADVGNAHEYEKQIRYLEQDVASRLYGGKIIAVGTRVGPQDLYSELLNPDRYISGVSPWSHLKQPAVLSFADEAKDWVTLWPRSNRPMDENADTEPDADGMFAAWDGPALENVRGSISPQRWALVYQQQPSSADSTFNPACVWASVDRRRKPGPLRAGGWGHPGNGGDDMYTIASIDPAMAGDCAIVVGKVDKTTQKRWIENVFVNPGSAEWIRNMIKQVTLDYGVNEFVVESNAFQLFLLHDAEIRQFMATRGVRWGGHYSGGFNKLDPDFGVAGLSMLFGSTRKHVDGGREVHNKDNLIELPDSDQSNGVKVLIEELLTWVPGKRGNKLRQDGPMALWFFNIAAMEFLGLAGDGQANEFVRTKYMTRNRSRQMTDVREGVRYSFGRDKLFGRRG